MTTANCYSIFKCLPFGLKGILFSTAGITTCFLLLLGSALNMAPKVSDVLFNVSPNARLAAAAQVACLNSGNQTHIQSRLNTYGEAKLCQGAVFHLTGSVSLAAGQQIYTEGNPTNDSRALLQIAADTDQSGIKLTTAINGLNNSNIDIHHIRIDGGRDSFAYFFGPALILVGGNASGQKVRFVKAWATRTWTTIHVFEGACSGGSCGCTGAQILNNEIGPAGYSDEAWADGITLGCHASTVQQNTIVDATDGGIVIFGAAGSEISNNTIKAQCRSLLGGINMIDNGNYTNTRVISNSIIAEGAQIKVGIPIGNFWDANFCAQRTISGGFVQNNSFQGAYMGYGIGAKGISNFTVTGNNSTAIHSGITTCGCGGTSCNSQAFQSDAPRAFLRDPITASSSNNSFQGEFQSASLNAHPVRLEPLSTWQSWTRVPGSGATPSSPAVTTAPNGSSYLAVRSPSPDNYAYYTQPDFQDYSSGWSLVSPAKSTPSQPAIVFDSAGRLRVYIRAYEQNRIFRNILQGGSWTGWNELPGDGGTISGPEAVLFNGQVNVIVRGTNDRIYYQIDESGSTPVWLEVPGGGTTYFSPSAASQGDKLYITVAGTNGDQSLHINTITGSWGNYSGWINLGGGLAVGPGAVLDTNGSLRIYVLGVTKRLYFGTWANGSWSGFGDLCPNAETQFAPDATLHNNSMRVFVTGYGEPSGAIWSASQ